MTLGDLRRFVKATKRSKAGTKIVVAVPTGKPWPGGGPEMRRCMASHFHTDGGQHGCDTVIIIEGVGDGSLAMGLKPL
jgi:hypothetical protein